MSRTTIPWVLPLMSFAQFMLALDFAIVNVALSTIQADVRFSSAGLQWVATGYALTFGAFLMAGGRLGDRFGLRRVLLIGMVVFGAASLSGGLAGSALMLVVSRLAQGAGAALMAPTAFAMVSGAYPDPAARARAVSLFQGSNAVGGLAGVVIGGLLTATVGWRWVLLVNPPVVILIGLLVLARIPASRPQACIRVDAAGAATLSIAVAALILFVSRLQQRSDSVLSTSGPAVIALAAAVAFVLIERRSGDPMLPASLLAHRRWSVLVATALLGAAMGGYAYFLALSLQRVLHFSAAAAGFAFLPATVTGLLASTQLAPRLLPRTGPRVGLLVALGVLALGQLWLARLPEDGTYAVDVLVGALPTAVGLGLAFPAAAVLITDRVPAPQLGVASALFPTGQQIGSAIGLAVLAAVAALPADGPALPYDRAFLLTAIAAAGAAALIAAAGPRTARTRTRSTTPSTTTTTSRGRAR